MSEIYYLERKTGQVKREAIYGKFFIETMYGSHVLSKIFSWFMLPLIAKISFFSKWYGKLQKKEKSQKKIVRFINSFGVDASEFEAPPDGFCSFNDFFIRKLKPSTRPIAPGEHVAVLPADGRYLFFSNLDEADGFYVKGKKFDLKKFLLDEYLFETYQGGSMVIGRLCPTDYHRFHFPCDCTPSKTKLINGPLYSVSPIALRRNISILSENKRMLTRLKTKTFGEVLFIEVGATFVGSIHQTYRPHVLHAKGEEKGYFEFGGSCVILLFAPNTIIFDDDILALSEREFEIKANMGESFGRAVCEP